MTEGKKTVAFEIAEQLATNTLVATSASPSLPARDSAANLSSQSSPSSQRREMENDWTRRFQAPDAIFVAVGDGCIIGGVHKGFKELLALGWIEKMPRIYGVQSIQSAALYHAWRADQEIPAAVLATTRADSISVNAPRDAVKALNAVRETDGAFLVVPDTAILQAILPLARLAAIFAEPAGAAAYAGLVEAVRQRFVQPDETIVVINTGSGLKDVPAVIQVAGEATVIPPTLDAVYTATKDGAAK